MKKVVLALSLLPCNLLAKNEPPELSPATKKEHEHMLKAYLYECIAGNNQFCEKFINASPQGQRKLQKLRRKRWVHDELQGRHLFQEFLKCKQTNKGNKRFIKHLMLQMEYNKLLKRSK